MVAPEVVRTTAQAYIEVARSLDVDRYASLLAEDAVRYNPHGRLQGRHAIRDSAARRWSQFASGEINIERLIVTGDAAAFSYTARLTTRDGRSASFDGIEMVEVNDAGQIVAVRIFYDLAAIEASLSAATSSSATT